MEERRQVAMLWSDLRSCSHFLCHETTPPVATAATTAKTVVGSAVSPPHINAEVLASKGGRAQYTTMVNESSTAMRETNRFMNCTPVMPLARPCSEDVRALRFSKE